MTLIGSISKLIKWYKVRQIKDNYMIKLQSYYFICYFSFMAGFIFQGPYVHHRYHEVGMSFNQIDNIMSLYNIISAIWGFFIGHVCELIGHKKLIILSALLLSLSSFCRFWGTYYSFLAASVLMGISTASNRVVFEDWLAEQLEKNNAPKESQAIIKENSSLINFCLNVLLGQISTFVTTRLGAKASFLGSTALFFSSSILIFFMMPSFNRNIEKNVGLLGAIKEFVVSLKQINFLAFFILDFLSAISLLLMMPRWTVFHKVDKTDILPFSNILNSSSISSMNGAQIFAALILLLSSQTALFSSFFSYFACVTCMYFFYENKNYVFLSFVLASMADGAVNSGMWVLRTGIYPSNIRKHIMGILRVPESILVSCILTARKGSDPKDILGLICIFALINSSISLFLTFRLKKADVKRD